MSILKKFKRKDYKALYETELNNRKIFEQRYKELKKENIELQKETGLADLRVRYNKALDEIAFLKEDRAKLYLQREDAINENDVLKSGLLSLGVKRVKNANTDKIIELKKDVKKKGGKKKNGNE